MANNEDRGFNTVNNSSLSRRDQRLRLQRMTLMVIGALMVLMVITLAVLIIGYFVSSGSGPSTDDPQGSASKDKVVWTSATVNAQDTVKGEMVLVNTSHEYVFPSTNEHMVNIYDVRATNHPNAKPYQLSSNDLLMAKEAFTALDRLLTDFSVATGKTDVTITETYRTKEKQEATGSSIPAGFSDHHTGYGCTLVIYDGENTYPLSSNAVYNWITENAAKYGFIIRYPADKVANTGVDGYTKYFRYVGVAHATYMYQNNLCMEEYVEYLKANVTDKKPLSVTGADGRAYDIYYYTVSGSATVKCPKNFAYTISGTNDGGVLVTVDRSVSSAETTPEA